MSGERKQNTRKGVWMMTLDRFGYDLVVVGRTKEEAAQAMRDEYVNAYAKWNELDEQTLRLALEFPVSEMDEDGTLYVDEDNPYNEFRKYYKNAFEDNDPRFYEFGKVEWE